jgi:hypothetical protein
MLDQLVDRDGMLASQIAPLAAERDLVRRQIGLAREMIVLEERHLHGEPRALSARADAGEAYGIAHQASVATSTDGDDGNANAGDYLVGLFRRANRPIHRTELQPMAAIAIQGERTDGPAVSTLLTRLTRDRLRRFAPVEGRRGYWTLADGSLPATVDPTGRQFVAAVGDALTAIRAWTISSSRVRDIREHQANEKESAGIRSPQALSNFRRVGRRRARAALDAIDRLDAAAAALGDQRRLFPPPPDLSGDRAAIGHWLAQEDADIEQPLLIK